MDKWIVTEVAPEFRGPVAHGLHLVAVRVHDDGLEFHGEVVGQKGFESLLETVKGVLDSCDIFVSFAGATIDGDFDPARGVLEKELNEGGRDKRGVGEEDNQKAKAAGHVIDVRKVRAEQRLAACQDKEEDFVAGEVLQDGFDLR